MEVLVAEKPSELREVMTAYGLAGKPRSTTIEERAPSAITFLRQERMARIEADLEVLTTDQMIKKYNPSGYEAIKASGGIMEPCITEAQKRRRANTVYDEPVKPNAITPVDMWGVRLPFFTQSEFAKVNAVLDTYKKPRRKPRREAREVGDAEVAGAVGRKGVAREARKAAKGEIEGVGGGGKRRRKGGKVVLGEEGRDAVGAVARVERLAIRNKT